MWDVAAMAAHLPRDSVTMLAVAPRQEVELWDVNSYLLASVVDLLAGANWQRTGKRSGNPKPVKRPKVNAPKTQKPGHESIADFKAWYAAQPGGRPID